MDPLSTTAGVIAVMQSLAMVGAGIQAVRSLHNAREECATLLEELTALQTALRLLKWGLESQGQSRGFIELDYLISITLIQEDLGRTVAGLQQLVEKCTRVKGTDKNGLPKIHRIKWYKARAKVSRLLERVYHLRQDIFLCLGALSTAQRCCEIFPDCKEVEVTHPNFLSALYSSTSCTKLTML